LAEDHAAASPSGDSPGTGGPELLAGLLAGIVSGGIRVVDLTLTLQPDFPTLHVILPVGLSFYTFQTMSYTIDVYMGRTKARRDFLTVCLFVCYFPQLVAGPVERAGRLLPQLERVRRLDWEMISDGCWFLFLGLFKKIAIANLIAAQVDPVFANLEEASLTGIFMACLGFSVQLYTDFSGYSDMAIGLSLLLGVRLSRNFRQPFLFANSFDEFWKRWHITMTSWFRDYVYAPLRSRNPASWQPSVALVATFTIVGVGVSSASLSAAENSSGVSTKKPFPPKPSIIFS